ncbi:MAG: hypothetical protein S4CHLAM81_13760 [Chlamydiales bacterium]|nr:hypothetical protein [Chlamydiales bacterium]MCH9636148.1 hypothetical protein [Chlamydiales bacterium]MCH9703259.1 type III secretion system chaperone [Chlamydiota bacterium]
MSDFSTFLKELSSLLRFTTLSPDRHGACLVVMKSNNLPLLFEYDDHLVPSTILLSTPICEVDPDRERALLRATLTANSQMEETLSVKPDEPVVYLHKRFSPQIEGAELKKQLDLFIESSLYWQNELESVNEKPGPASQPKKRNPGSRFRV